MEKCAGLVLQVLARCRIRRDSNSLQPADEGVEACIAVDIECDDDSSQLVDVSGQDTFLEVAAEVQQTLATSSIHDAALPSSLPSSSSL